MLRVSSDFTNDKLDIGQISSADGLGSGVQHGDLLVRFADATLKGTPEALSSARQAVAAAIGTAGLVDAAAIIATFTLQNRAADAAGLPLDTPIEVATRRMRTRIGADQFNAASYTAKGSWVSDLLTPIAEPLAKSLFKLIGRRSKKR